jgi:hypothetical protein
MNGLKLTLFIFFIFLVFQAELFAQETDIAESEIVIHKMRLPFPASKDKKPKYYSLNDEVAIALNQVKRELGLYDIIMGIYIDSTTQVEDSTFGDFLVFNFNEVTHYKEAIVIIGSQVSQQGVSQQEDEAYFSLGENDSVEKKSAGSSKDIQTQLLAYALFVDIETGESLGSLDFEVFHTDGLAKKSKSQAIKLLKKKAKAELKRIYWFSADVIKTKKGAFGIPYGTISRINKGLIFELVEPDRVWELDEEEILVPGSSAAIATVIDTSADSSGFRILRQWRDIYPGSWAVELPKKIYALEFNFIPPAADAYTNLGILFHAGPMHDFDWGIGMQIMRVTDSFGNDDYGFGFDVFGLWRFLNTTKIDFGGKVGLDFDIPFRKDDDGQTVHTLLFSVPIGMVGEFMLSQNFDFVIYAGYRFSVKSDNWEYSDDEENYKAYWEENAPEVENSGLMLSIGFKYFLF